MRSPEGGLDFAIEEIERLKGIPDGTFTSLPRERQIRLLAWYETYLSIHTPQKKPAPKGPPKPMPRSRRGP